MRRHLYAFFIVFLLFFYDLPLRSPVIWGKSGYQSNNYWALGTTPRAKLLSTTHIVSKNLVQKRTLHAFFT